MPCTVSVVISPRSSVMQVWYHWQVMILWTAYSIHEWVHRTFRLDKFICYIAHVILVISDCRLGFVHSWISKSQVLWCGWALECIICFCHSNFFFFATYPVMVGNFRGFKFFMKQAKIRVSEIFTVLIITVGESGTCRLASCTAKKAEWMSRIVYREKWQSQLFVSEWQESSHVPMMFVEMIASAVSLAPLSGSCICAYM